MADRRYSRWRWPIAVLLALAAVIGSGSGGVAVPVAEAQAAKPDLPGRFVVRGAPLARQGRVVAGRTISVFGRPASVVVEGCKTRSRQRPGRTIAGGRGRHSPLHWHPRAADGEGHGHGWSTARHGEARAQHAALHRTPAPAEWRAASRTLVGARAQGGPDHEQPRPAFPGRNLEYARRAERRAHGDLPALYLDRGGRPDQCGAPRAGWQDRRVDSWRTSCCGRDPGSRQRQRAEGAPQETRAYAGCRQSRSR